VEVSVHSLTLGATSYASTRTATSVVINVRRGTGRVDGRHVTTVFRAGDFWVTRRLCFCVGRDGMATVTAENL